MAGHSGGHDHHRGWRDQSRGSGPAGRGRIRSQAVYRGSNQGEAGRNSGTGADVMNLRDFIVNSICQSVTQIFSTMLGVEIQTGEISVETGSPEANDGVVSLIGLAGTW